DSIDIDDIIDFEQAIGIQNKKNKREILRNNILGRIAQKKTIMNDVKPITLIGHSIIDNWDISHINKVKVNNLGISGINTEEYYKFILDTKESIALGDTVILMSGTNDIVLDNWDHNYTLYWLDKTLNKIKEINSQARVYLIETPPVRGRIDRNNEIIKELNKSLKHH
ncbi:GDSL-type esterase/lipase family protein, partial [Morganella morganii]